MKPLAWVLDRIEQSFELFSKWVIYLILPLFLYNFASFLVTLLVSLFILLWWYLDNLIVNQNYSDLLLSVVSNPKIIFLVSIWSLFGLIYLFLYIPFYIYTIKSIKDLYEWRSISFKENFKYGFDNFFNIMKTYRNIFAYVSLIPCLIFIFWWLILNLWYFLELWDHIINTSFFIMWFSIILFIAFLVYRWIRVKFSVFSAIDNNNYTKENFVFSVKITEKTWFRVLWNFLLIWIIIWLLSWVATNIIWVFFWQSFDFFNDLDNWKVLGLDEMISSFSFLNYIISWFFDLIIKNIWNVFVLVFTYIFYKRLELEDEKEIIKDILSEKKEEL
jgi:hypothetical protein